MLQRKKLLPFFLIIVLAAAFLNVRPVSSAEPKTKLSTYPRISYAEIDASLSVNVTVSDVLYLYAWGINMTFNQSVLELVDFALGGFLERQPEGAKIAGKRINQTEGWAYLAASTIGAHPGVSGSGVLAIVEFRVLAVGESVFGFSSWENRTELLLQSSSVYPPQLEDIPFIAEDGFFSNVQTPPVADFTYSPLVFGINETVTFDATASNATAPFEIIEYFWDFGDDTNATVTTPTVPHNFTKGGSFTVSLTVFDNATASPLVESQFPDDTRVKMGFMPLIWYEVYSTKKTILGLAFAHDIAIFKVQPSETEVPAGTTVSINVTVLNRGTEREENFDVTAYYDTNVIESKQESLDSGETKSLIFNWDTTGVPEGDYLIKAEASGIEGEENPGDNEFLDGTVTIVAGSEPFPTTLIIIGVGAGIAIVLVVILLFMRRRSAPSTST